MASEESAGKNILANDEIIGPFTSDADPEDCANPAPKSDEPSIDLEDNQNVGQRMVPNNKPLPNESLDADLF